MEDNKQEELEEEIAEDGGCDCSHCSGCCCGCDEEEETEGEEDK